MLTAALGLPFFLLGFRSWLEVGIVAGVLMVWALIATFWEKWREHRSRSWPTAPGAISNVASTLKSGGANGVDYYKISFDYTYSVQQEHKGAYSFNVMLESQSDRAMAGLKDKTIPVHYQPSNEAKPLIWEDEVWNLWYG